MGNAVIDACASVKEQLRHIIEATPGATKDMPFADALKAHFGPPRGELIGIGEAGNAYEPGHPLGGRAAFWELMCAASEVEVDPETGEVTVHKLALVSDVGKALNPQQVEAQDEGAAVMGLGHTLMEQLVLGTDGRILNLGSLDYRIPSIKDTPLELHSELIENADGPGPYGAKGAGEGGTLAVAAAVGAAINQAAGITLRDLPLTPEKIWRAMNRAP
jgi:CO/xanthine dehydrogenase Mo-binding subunit